MISSGMISRIFFSVKIFLFLGYVLFRFMKIELVIFSASMKHGSLSENNSQDRIEKENEFLKSKIEKMALELEKEASNSQKIEKQSENEEQITKELEKMKNKLEKVTQESQENETKLENELKNEIQRSQEMQIQIKKLNSEIVFLEKKGKNIDFQLETFFSN